MYFATCKLILLNKHILYLSVIFIDHIKSLRFRLIKITSPKIFLNKTLLPYVPNYRISKIFRERIRF